jgi:hypothetical protein
MSALIEGLLLQDHGIELVDLAGRAQACGGALHTNQSTRQASRLARGEINIRRIDSKRVHKITRCRDYKM